MGEKAKASSKKCAASGHVGETGNPKSKNESQASKKEPQAEKQWTETLEDDYQRILSVGEECINPSELKSLLLAKGRESGVGFNLYDGFEPSGRMHIAQGVFKAVNVNKCTDSGGLFIFWVADWFALMNDKMGGDLDKIKIVGKYLQQVWKAAGMNLDRVVFKWASDEITNCADIYWPQVLDVARRFNITRIKKCCQIMGRLEGSLTAAQVLYPLMQCTDVFFLKADICQLGVDQRKVNMLAREYCDAAGIKKKPIILSHHMLFGLKAGQQKMSKSDPDSAVFMEDSAADVERKILNAYCPTKEELPDENEQIIDAGKESMQIEVDHLRNPCLDYIRNIIFGVPGAVFSCAGTDYFTFDAVKTAFLDGSITEDQLKRALIDALNGLLEPVRRHFASDATAQVLLEQVQQFKKETVKPTGKPRRLDLVGNGMVESNSHLVFAPSPSSKPTLQEAVHVIARLRAGSAPRVLYLSDWAARVTNACDADTRAVAAYYTVLLAGLSALDPELMKSVRVVHQSKAILSDPSNYWISVINVGRHFMLDDVMGNEMHDSDCVGSVISRMMLVADSVSVNPKTIAFSGVPRVRSTESKLVADFFRKKPSDLAAPVVSDVGGPSVVLQRRQDKAHATDNDEYFLLDDPKVSGKSKMKKAFCEPGNISFCPPMDVASAFAFGIGKEPVLVSRTPENGGDVSYKDRPEMEADFKDGNLHPGDLKASATKIIVGVLQEIADAVKVDPEAAKASKALKAFQKKL